MQKAIHERVGGRDAPRCPEWGRAFTVRTPRPFTRAAAKDRAAHPSDACVIVENIVENMVERMPLRVVAAILLAAGCAPVSAQPRGAPSPASAAPRSAVTAPVELRVSLDENTHYRRSREAFAGWSAPAGGGVRLICVQSRRVSAGSAHATAS